MKFWRRPLHAMTSAFTAALTALGGPQRELFPDGFRSTVTRWAAPP
ncbi:hypothetical protein [Amycolatopsis thermalba]